MVNCVIASHYNLDRGDQFPSQGVGKSVVRVFLSLLCNQDSCCSAKLFHFPYGAKLFNPGYSKTISLRLRSNEKLRLPAAATLWDKLFQVFAFFTRKWNFCNNSTANISDHGSIRLHNFRKNYLMDIAWNYLTNSKSEKIFVIIVYCHLWLDSVRLFKTIFKYNILANSKHIMLKRVL